MLARRIHQASAAQDSLERILNQSKDRPRLRDSTQTSYSSSESLSREAAVFEDVLNSVTKEPGRAVLSDNLEDRVKRLRRFLEYVICIDYHVKPRTKLSQTDRQYFARINDGILECHDTLSAPSPDYNGQNRLAGYIWDHIHEPCHKTGLRPEYAMTAITRSFKYQLSGKYNGCVWEILRDQGIGPLAEKLSVDRYEMISAVFKSCPAELRRAVYSGEESCRKEFFVIINRPEEVPSGDTKDWSQHKQVWFMPNGHCREMAASGSKIEEGACVVM